MEVFRCIGSEKNVPVYLKKFDKSEQGLAAWKFERQSLVTATDIGDILGLNPFRTIEQFIHEKKYGVFNGNAYTEAGQDLEPAVLNRFKRIQKLDNVHTFDGNMLVTCPNYLLSATPDAYVGNSIETLTHAVELKATSLKSLKNWQKYKPYKYFAQLAQQSLLLGCEEGFLAGMSPELYPDLPMRIFYYTRSKELEEIIIDQAALFGRNVFKGLEYTVSSTLTNHVRALLRKSFVLIHSSEALVQIDKITSDNSSVVDF